MPDGEVKHVIREDVKPGTYEIHANPDDGSDILVKTGKQEIGQALLDLQLIHAIQQSSGVTIVTKE